MSYELDIKPMVVEEIDMTKESAGSKLLSYYPESTQGLYTVADFNEVHVENTLDDNDKTFITIVFTPCNKLAMTGLSCADEQEMDDFYNDHLFMMVIAQNYIDMDQVKPAEESLQQVHDYKLVHNFSTQGRTPMRMMALNEFQSELFDDRFDLFGFSESIRIDYMNFNEETSIDSLQVGDAVLEIVIGLSKKITKQKRTVYNIFMMFGDVGGLYDFLRLCLAVVFGLFSRNMMQASLIEQLFLISEPTP